MGNQSSAHLLESKIGGFVQAGEMSVGVVNIGKGLTHTTDASCSRKVRSSCLIANPSPIEVVKGGCRLRDAVQDTGCLVHRSLFGRQRIRALATVSVPFIERGKLSPKRPASVPTGVGVFQFALFSYLPGLLGHTFHGFPPRLAYFYFLPGSCFHIERGALARTVRGCCTFGSWPEVSSVLYSKSKVPPYHF